jgi:hypothetical protein
MHTRHAGRGRRGKSRQISRNNHLSVLALPRSRRSLSQLASNVHGHLATNLNHVRLVLLRIFVTGRWNGFSDPPMNVAVSTPKPREDICISRSSLRISNSITNTLLVIVFRGSSLVRASKLTFPTDFFLHATPSLVCHPEPDYLQLPPALMIQLHDEIQIRRSCGFGCHWCVCASRSCFHKMRRENVCSTLASSIV